MNKTPNIVIQTKTLRLPTNLDSIHSHSTKQERGVLLTSTQKLDSELSHSDSLHLIVQYNQMLCQSMAKLCSEIESLKSMVASSNPPKKSTHK